MFPRTELCLWRDQRDEEQLVIGSVTRVHTPTGSRRRYTSWFTCHVDALLVLADKRFYDRVVETAADEFPLPLELTLTFKSER